jgi:nickel superoxide dismutase
MKSIKIIWIIVLFVMAEVSLGAHCEIPCGIYEDSMRISLIREHITTIEKSMKEINELGKSENPNYNQLVRWIMNKEDHADKIQDVATQYFMTQRIKTDTPDYGKKLSLLHQMLIVAMKCKQTTDLTNVELLRSLTTQFESLYMKEK